MVPHSIIIIIIQQGCVNVVSYTILDDDMQKAIPSGISQVDGPCHSVYGVRCAVYDMWCTIYNSNKPASHISKWKFKAPIRTTRQWPLLQ